jgi:hypothetical protein
VERENKERVHSHSTAISDRRPVHDQLDEEAATQRIEAVLNRLEQIERGTMQTPANTIVGLGVKARQSRTLPARMRSASTDQLIACT